MARLSPSTRAFLGTVTVLAALIVVGFQAYGILSVVLQSRRGLILLDGEIWWVGRFFVTFVATYLSLLVRAWVRDQRHCPIEFTAICVFVLAMILSRHGYIVWVSIGMVATHFLGYSSSLDEISFNYSGSDC